MKLNIGDKVMVKARGDNNRHWDFGVDSEYVECTIEGEVCHAACWDCDTVVAMGPHHRQHVPVSAIKPSKKPFALKDGKKYETSDGVVFKVRNNSDGFFDENDDSMYVWRADGTGVGNPDLIRRHYTKPQPAHKLDLKKGDVVELVKWEDGAGGSIGRLLTSGSKGVLSGVFSDYPKGERPLFKVVSRA